MASQRETEAEALVNLGEALALHFTPPVATNLPTCDRSRSKSVPPKPLPFREVKRNLEAVGFTDYGRTYRR